MDSPRTGIILANTGTPDAPTAPALRRYLAQFLSDQRIIETPRWIWWPILHGIVLRVRPRRSAALYQRVWTEAGSPLLFHTAALATAVEKELNAAEPGRYKVVPGMRYGTPNLPTAINELRRAGAEEIVIMPLFPQTCGATTGSIVDGLTEALTSQRNHPALRVTGGYHLHPPHIQALAQTVRRHWAERGQDGSHLLMSFHGIPQSYVSKGDTYASQCAATATALASELGLTPADYTVSYQSRFGPAAWLQPYTVEALEDLAKRGYARLDAICPGFAVDCLETIDEIGHEGQRQYQEAGGGDFAYIPALNSSPEHAKVLAELLRAP